MFQAIMHITRYKSGSIKELVSRAEGKERETQGFVYRSSESPSCDSYISVEEI
jgi:hypothetical protein